jgi:hypothetical protein
MSRGSAPAAFRTKPATDSNNRKRAPSESGDWSGGNPWEQLAELRQDVRKLGAARPDLGPLQQQDREQGALLGPAQWDRNAGVTDFERAKDAELHCAAPGPQPSAARARSSALAASAQLSMPRLR